MYFKLNEIIRKPSKKVNSCSKGVVHSAQRMHYLSA